MLREMNINDITEDKLFGANDMVKLGVDDCNGCHACCLDTGDTLNLDPYDVFRLEAGLGLGFGNILPNHLELRVADGLIMPFLKMDKELTITCQGNEVKETSACTFLNSEGRCDIHEYRPAICRLFPLGRIYVGEGHKYLLMEDECKKDRRVKVKIKKWLNTENFARYEEYVDHWHGLVKGVTSRAKEMDEETLKNINMLILQTFYFADYDVSRDFYEQYYERCKAVKI